MDTPDLQYDPHSPHRVACYTDYTLTEWMRRIPSGAVQRDGVISLVADLSCDTPRPPKQRGNVEIMGGRRDGQKELSPASWLVEGIIPGGHLGIVGTEEGSLSNSALSIDLAVAMACNSTWPALQKAEKRGEKSHLWNDHISLKDRLSASAFSNRTAHPPLGTNNMEGRVLYLSGNIEITQTRMDKAFRRYGGANRQTFKKNIILSDIGTASMDSEDGIATIAKEIGIASSRWNTTIKYDHSRDWDEDGGDEPAHLVPEVIFIETKSPVNSLNAAEIIRETMGCAGTTGLFLQQSPESGAWCQEFNLGRVGLPLFSREFQNTTDHREIKNLMNQQRETYRSLFNRTASIRSPENRDIQSENQWLEFAFESTENPWQEYANGGEEPELYNSRRIIGRDRKQLQGNGRMPQSTVIVVNTNLSTIGAADFEFGTLDRNKKFYISHHIYPSPFNKSSPLKILNLDQIATNRILEF